MALNYIYICPPQRHRSKHQNSFPASSKTKPELALSNYFLASTSTKAISQNGVSLCRFRYVLSLSLERTPLLLSFTTRCANFAEIQSRKETRANLETVQSLYSRAIPLKPHTYMTSSTAGPTNKKPSCARPLKRLSTKFSHATILAGKPVVRVCRRS